MMCFDDIKAYRTPRWSDLPDIDLYMDQVLVVLDKYLSIFKTDADEKILTSAMINNYVKQKITPAPVNKKYTRHHIAFIFIVCVLKNYTSLSDTCNGINVLLKGRHTAEAFDMFADEFDCALDEVFGGKTEKREVPETNEGKILQAVTTAIANMLYVKCMLGSISSAEASGEDIA